MNDIGSSSPSLALSSADGNRIDDQLRYLQAVADAKEFKVASQEGERLSKLIAAR
jgi:hypothetical protein